MTVILERELGSEQTDGRPPTDVVDFTASALLKEKACLSVYSCESDEQFYQNIVVR
jgi:hypothetical protein